MSALVFDVRVRFVAYAGLLAMFLSSGLCQGGESAGPASGPKADAPSKEQPSAQQPCPLGTGLREETASIILKYKEHPGMVMAPSAELAAKVFPQIPGWLRVLGAPSLPKLKESGQLGREMAIPYESLTYGLETGKSTPEEEWHDMIGSTRKAKDICDQFGKQLMMGPGGRLMSQNEDKYVPMTALSEFWVFQTQRYQIDPPGEQYRKNVEATVKKIKEGNPKIIIWAQITFPPFKEPNAEEWLAYRRCITDVVDGAYVGAYTWDQYGEQLPKAIETIFQEVYDKPSK
ncbi:MAG: hypothetical protein NTW86_15135 [Candidatus Sumerlaeota bacterium]|nr:hypothetical protein [Candidatus Sumerlaeota bacterium]